MTSSIDDLAADLEQFFSRRFAPGGTDEPGAMILVFDGLGTPLQASEFAGSGEGAALDLVAHQRAAQLADQLPAPNGLASGWYLPRSGSRLSRWYEAVVEGARSTATNEEDVTAFDLMRHEAERRFAENQLVVTSGTAIGGEGGTISAAGTHDAYFATTMSPLDWFSESSASWASYEVKAGDAPAPAPAPVAEAPPIVPRPMFPAGG